MNLRQTGQFKMDPVENSENNLPPSDKFRSVISNLLLFLVTPIIIAFVLTSFVIQSYQVDGESMETTLQNHDRLIVDKMPRTWSKLTGHQYVPSRGDIVIFNQSGLPDSLGQKQLIKRVIGLPNERVVINNGSIAVFNKDAPSGFNPDTSGNYKITQTTSGDMTVNLGPNEIFVCGDNRNNSEDSRYFGPVNTKNLVGKLVLRILPFNKTESF